MATVTVRNLDESTKRALQHRAVRHGVSMEQEVRAILRAAVVSTAGFEKEENLYDAVRKLVDKYGGFDLELPPREPMREPPSFD